MDKVKLLETSGNLYSFYYTLGDTIDYYYGSLLPSTGYIRLFDIVKYYDGLLLRVPNRQNPDKLEEVVKQEKMLDVFKEHRRWNQILGIGTVGDFNVVCNNGHATDLINVSEALQEKRFQTSPMKSIIVGKRPGSQTDSDIRSLLIRKNDIQQTTQHPAYGQWPETLSYFVG